jgi:hypothetical protein
MRQDDRARGDHRIVADGNQPRVASVDEHAAPDVHSPTEVEALRDQAVDVQFSA